jgi:hypothetical protein
MQKVESSSLFSRLIRKPRTPRGFLLPKTESLSPARRLYNTAVQHLASPMCRSVRRNPHRVSARQKVQIAEPTYSVPPPTLDPDAEPDDRRERGADESRLLAWFVAKFCPGHDLGGAPRVGAGGQREPRQGRAQRGLPGPTLTAGPHTPHSRPVMAG